VLKTRTVSSLPPQWCQQGRKLLMDLPIQWLERRSYYICGDKDFICQCHCVVSWPTVPLVVVGWSLQWLLLLYVRAIYTYPEKHMVCWTSVKHVYGCLWYAC